ncbi:hypothetical protein [Nostoc sp. PCC 9305]
MDHQEKTNPKTQKLVSKSQALTQLAVELDEYTSLTLASFELTR